MRRVRRQAGGGPATGHGPAGTAAGPAGDYPYRYRRSYYSDWGYYPWWWGTYDPYYNDYGYRYFDDDDDDDGGGFGDS
jgi:hypothetical protein